MNKPDKPERSNYTSDMHTEVTNYQRMKAQLRVAEQLSNASIDCVLALDLDARVIYWNATCADFSGMSAKAVLGKSFYECFPKIGANVKVLSGLVRVKEGHKVFISVEKDLWIPGHFELHLVPLRDEEDNVDGILLIAHDVAHRVKAEQELQALNRQLQEKYRALEQANSTLATFTHHTSRDLKQPLRTMYSSLEKLIMSEGNKLSLKARSTIRKAQSSAQRISLLADSLTTFSELKSVMEQDINLEDVLTIATKDLKALINESGATIKINKLPSIKGDANQLKTMFTHLLSNAMKFQADGNKPVIEIIATKYEAEALTLPFWMNEQYYWCISVSDNGVGIPKEDQERIFDLFEKGQQQGKYAGAGIGLAMVKKIAANHGGCITVSTGENGGSIFSCYFPAPSS